MKHIKTFENYEDEEQLTPLSSHSSGRRITDITYSPDGKYVFAADGRLTFYDAKKGSKIKTFNLPDVTAVTFSPDGSHVIVGTAAGDVLYVDVVTGKIQNTFI